MNAAPFDGIAAVGDVTDIHAWSGTPWHFWQATRQLGWNVEPWRLDLGRFAWSRRRWNLRQVLLGRGRGGFQYSDMFLDAAESQIPSHCFSGRILTFNQHFPRAATVRPHGGRLWHYIDAPFAAFVQGRGLDLRLPSWIRERALAVERENYAASEHIFCMATWAADAVVELCGVPRGKVSVVLPGANLDLPEDFMVRELPGKPGVDRPLVLGFVGRDWQRKGLPFLLEVADELGRLGLESEVRAIGFEPASGPRHARLRALGFIDKSREARAFIDFLQQCDLGCLFSTHEALGISILEFLRVGVPVTGFIREGMADTLVPSSAIRIPFRATPGQAADELRRGFLGEDRSALLRKGARTIADRVTWERCLMRLTTATSSSRDHP